MTRLVCISDTHEAHDKIEIPDGDILICSGDFTFVGDFEMVKEFNEWLATLPHQWKLIVAGNHDRTFQTHASLAESYLTAGTYLRDKEITINGLKFWGSPWQPEFCNWAFNLPRGKALKEKWDLIPKDTDVLITHGPPYEILDANEYGEACGDEELLEAVERIQPKVHIFGHIHEGYGTIDIGKTTFVNASIMNERYRPVNKPIVIDL